MASGKVKWFNNAKGYGFILPDQGGEDLFAHFSTIQMDGYKTLRAGQDVSFEIETGPKGLHAINIRGLGEDVSPAAAESGAELSTNGTARGSMAVQNGASSVHA